MAFTVIRGDIAAESADAPVNAAGTSLRMESGVAGALRRGAGEEINEAAMEQGPVDLGGVAVTDAYDLDAEYVIHAAAMPHYGGHGTPEDPREDARTEGSGGEGTATEESIRDAARNALATADERGCESLVMPALGCGVAGLPLEDGARLVCEGYWRTIPSRSRTCASSPTPRATTRRCLGWPTRRARRTDATRGPPASPLPLVRTVDPGAFSSRRPTDGLCRGWRTHSRSAGWNCRTDSTARPCWSAPATARARSTP